MRNNKKIYMNHMSKWRETTMKQWQWLRKKTWICEENIEDIKYISMEERNVDWSMKRHDRHGGGWAERRGMTSWGDRNDWREGWQIMTARAVWRQRNNGMNKMKTLCDEYICNGKQRKKRKPKKMKTNEWYTIIGMKGEWMKGKKYVCLYV